MRIEIASTVEWPHTREGDQPPHRWSDVRCDPQVKGLDKASEVGFGNYQPKTWFGDLWRSQS